MHVHVHVVYFVGAAQRYSLHTPPHRRTADGIKQRGVLPLSRLGTRTVGALSRALAGKGAAVALGDPRAPLPP